MTWSTVIHEELSGAFAVAVATCALAVGASCPFVRAGVGAVSTQAFTNRYLGPAVLDEMARGLTPADAIARALASDDGRGLRQVHAVDRHGRAAAWTGENCVMWCGSEQAHGVSVAGNMLASEDVVSDTLAALEADLPLPERLAQAMLAGQSAGGDRRGRRSAAMLMTTTEDFPDLNLRVDDHPDPLTELDRLVALWRKETLPLLPMRPSRQNPSGVTDLDQIEASWIAQGLDIRLRR